MAFYVIGTACHVVPIFVPPYMVFLLLKMSVAVTKVQKFPKNPKKSKNPQFSKKAKICKKKSHKKSKKPKFAKKSKKIQKWSHLCSLRGLGGTKLGPR
jgi:hypothetical protein